MFKFFFNWIKGKFGPTLPGWIVFSIAVISGLIVVVATAMHANTTDPLWTLTWFIALANEVAKIVFTAIIAGAVLKVMAVQGFFEKALTDIVFGEKGLDLMDNSKRLEVWKRLTCRIHVPFLHEKRSDNSLETFYTRLLEAEGRQIEYRQNFYIESISRELKFKWTDAGQKFVVVEDFMQAVLVAFDSKTEIQWQSRRNVKGAITLEEYQIEDTSIEMDGEDVSKRRVEMSSDRKIENRIHFLSGLQKYNITRNRSQIWHVENDPVMSITTPYVISGGTFKVSNLMDDTKLLFQELGGIVIGPDLFTPVSGSSMLHYGEDLRRRISTVLLPNQGFQVIILRTAPQVAPGQATSAHGKDADAVER